MFSECFHGLLAKVSGYRLFDRFAASQKPGTVAAPLAEPQPPPEPTIAEYTSDKRKLVSRDELGLAPETGPATKYYTESLEPKESTSDSKPHVSFDDGPMADPTAATSGDLAAADEQPEKEQDETEDEGQEPKEKLEPESGSEPASPFAVPKIL